MATQTTEDILDLVNTTLPHLGRGKFTDLSTDLNNFHALTMLQKKENVDFIKGQANRLNFVTGNNGSAHARGLYEEDSYDVVDVTTKGTLPWRHYSWYYAFDRVEDELNDSDDEQILKLLKIRRHSGLMSLAEILETDFWGKPAASTDEETLWGVRMYIVPNATTGFNGGNPSGFTTGTALDSTVVTRYKNWTAQYTNISNDDLVFKMRQAILRTNFQSPVSTAEARKIGERKVMYGNQDVYLDLSELVRQNNENLGSDLAKYEGDIYVAKCPFRYVAKLNGESTDPIIGINWDALKFFALKGEYLREDKARQHPRQHTVMVVDGDLTCNLGCSDRRSCFSIDKA
jgi:hypothetical protein